jgi:hypothetical protein
MKLFSGEVWRWIVGTIILSVLTTVISERNERNKSMTEYIEQMQKLMLVDNSGHPGELAPIYQPKDNPEKWLARALTLNVLRRLEGYNVPILNQKVFPAIIIKAQVIKFLYESKLIGYCLPTVPTDKIVCTATETSIKLADAVFDGSAINSSIKELNGIDLSGAQLAKANLEDLRLTNVNLRNVDLKGAYLKNSLIDNANLTYAKLDNADLTAINLTSTNLNNADLTRANLSKANLQKAKLCETTLVGIKWDVNKPPIFKDAVYNDSTEFGTIFDSEEGKKLKETMIKNNPKLDKTIPTQKG